MGVAASTSAATSATSRGFRMLGAMTTKPKLR
jgi:hypothetical protein